MKNIKKILCLCYLSVPGITTIKRAKALADQYNAELNLLYVYRTPWQYLEKGLPRAAALERREQLMRFAATYIDIKRVKLSIATGYTGDAVADKAKDISADMILLPDTTDELYGYIRRNISAGTLLIRYKNNLLCKQMI